MAGFRPEMESCPVCGASHSCTAHSSYERNLIDFIQGRPVYHMIKVVRVICSCGHTHAILPDLIIPYNTYGVFFILRVIAEYLLHRHSIEHLCARFSITHSMLYRWYGLFLEHKSLWLGVLRSSESAPSAFLASITCELPFSSFASDFILKTSISFLQSHANPAHYRQTVF